MIELDRQWGPGERATLWVGLGTSGSYIVRFNSTPMVVK